MMTMLYPLPNKIQLRPSQSKWRIQSEQSVLVLVGLDDLKALQYKHLSSKEQQQEDHSLFEHLTQLFKKAKALNIPIVDLKTDQMMQGMFQLGEHLSHHRQLMIAGHITAVFKPMVQHLFSVSEQICLVDDALFLENQEAHIQWIDSCTAQGLHHINTSTALRMWSLSAPAEFILSQQGILLAVAEQLDVEPLEIDPMLDLRQYGLDSVAIVSLIGLWRANGANITYEDFLAHSSLEKLMNFLTC